MEYTGYSSSLYCILMNTRTHTHTHTHTQTHTHTHTQTHTHTHTHTETHAHTHTHTHLSHLTDHVLKLQSVHFESPPFSRVLLGNLPQVVFQSERQHSELLEQNCCSENLKWSSSTTVLFTWTYYISVISGDSKLD